LHGRLFERKAQINAKATKTVNCNEMESLLTVTSPPQLPSHRFNPLTPYTARHSGATLLNFNNCEKKLSFELYGRHTPTELIDLQALLYC
jgi:hypothetical protein